METGKQFLIWSHALDNVFLQVHLQSQESTPTSATNMGKPIYRFGPRKKCVIVCVQYKNKNNNNINSTKTSKSLCSVSL